MSRTPMVRHRLRGVAAALRFSWIPIVCALVVAVASEDPRGRVLAALIALVVLGLGVVVHVREILAVQPARHEAQPQHTISTGEWMARLR